jgi:hypothetical protein
VYTTDRYAQTLWRPEKVQKILNNTAYIGQRIHHKTETGMRGTNAKMVPPDQRIQIMNAHEPLVSQMLFDKVQSMNCKSKKLRGTGKRLAPVCDLALRKTLCKRYSTKSALMLRFGTLCALISLGHPRSSRGRQYARA